MTTKITCVAHDCLHLKPPNAFTCSLKQIHISPKDQRSMACCVDYLRPEIECAMCNKGVAFIVHTLIIDGAIYDCCSDLCIKNLAISLYEG